MDLSNLQKHKCYMIADEMLFVKDLPQLCPTDKNIICHLIANKMLCIEDLPRISQIDKMKPHTLIGGRTAICHFSTLFLLWSPFWKMPIFLPFCVIFWKFIPYGYSFDRVYLKFWLLMLKTSIFKDTYEGCPKTGAHSLQMEIFIRHVERALRRFGIFGTLFNPYLHCDHKWP